MKIIKQIKQDLKECKQDPAPLMIAGIGALFFLALFFVGARVMGVI